MDSRARDQPVELDVSVRWNHGARWRTRCRDPLIQVHHLDGNTVVLRQSKATHYEAPFLYLLFGEERALLLDTGATADPVLFPLRSVVDDLCKAWLSRNPRDNYELVVAHTHSHGDHVAADAQFVGRPLTTVVGTRREEVAQFFGLSDWPRGEATFDIGDRELHVLPIPGHEPASIAIYDPRTHILLTGDTVYPGRLYVQNFSQFQASIAKLEAFAASNPISHLMGAHVEMSARPRRDYPLGTTYQPREAALWMSVDQLHAIGEAARSVAHVPGAHQFDDFAIFHGPCKAARARQHARAFLLRLWPLPA